MHFLITVAGITAFIAFAFGENVARGFVQGMFILAGCAVVLLLWDVYRAIPEKKPDRYKVLELEFEPKKQQHNPAVGWTFK